MIAPARRVSDLPASATVILKDRISAMRASGQRVLDLAGGDPNFATPAHITAAAVESLRAGRTHYGPSAGTPQLRRAIVAELAERGISYDGDGDVVVTASAKYALALTLAAVLDTGDEVIIPEPGWVSYRPLVQLSGGVAVPVALDPEDGFRLERVLLERAVSERSKALLINSPNNPTGRVLDVAEIAAVVEVAQEHDLLIVSDEIYRRLVFDGRCHHSPAELAPERTAVVDGVSKAYAMTGWRLGWLAAPRHLAAAALSVQQHTITCAATFVQDAGVAALTGPQEPVEQMLRAYQRRRDRVLEILAAVPGIRARRPDGAFYLFADVSATGMSSSEFAAWLLDVARVAVVPGESFGNGGAGHVRISLAVDDGELDRALVAMANALRQHCVEVSS